MDINQAKEEIKNAMVAYFTKNEMGDYVIPQEKQRPIFLMGPPGIGKTAIMEQIASEMDVGLLSYSMTHHTRQSALGLPFISKKVYDGVEYNISEYTMSEIIASVYDMMEDTGVKEGILFLDEINCVSETLSPIMLQFLQYKVFGKHKVPKGWVVVTAGNPLEFNNSAKDFDIVTWDRLKRIDVEPNFECWKKYAYKAKIHPSIVSFLDVKTNYFYKIETTVNGKSFATARGWEDLSQMILLYELNNIEVTYDLVSQYIQNRKIAKDFIAYHGLYKKYRSNYQINKILDGNIDDVTKKKAEKAPFDEKLAIISLLIEGLTNISSEIIETDCVFSNVRTDIVNLKQLTKVKEVVNKIDYLVEKRQGNIIKNKQANKISARDIAVIKKSIALLETIKQDLLNAENPNFEIVRKTFNSYVNKHKKNVTKAKDNYTNVFNFVSDVFGEENELLIFIAELTTNFYTANYINTYGCDEYYKYNKKMYFSDRQKELLKEIQLLEIEK